MKLARQGYTLIFPAFAIFDLTLIWYILSGRDIPLYLAIASGLLALFFVFFFRDPERNVPSGKKAVVSAADGRVIAIDSVIPDYMPGYRTRISVFLSILNVHVNRIPCAGRISRIEYHRGKFKPAFTESAAAENEHSIIEMASAHGNIGFCQRAGTLARRISCNLRVGQDVQTGERFGMIRFGSRVDLYLPENIDILVRKGMKVKAGETVLAEFIGNES